MKPRILIVDDEEIVIRSCRRVLAEDDYQIESVADGWEAVRRVDAQVFDLVLLDIMMPKVGGIEVLQHVKERHPETEVVMVTGLAQIETAVKAMKLGAFDYLPKPFEPEQLRDVVARALLLRQSQRVAGGLDVGTTLRVDNLIGQGPAMQKVFQLIARCAPTRSTVLITGESGTGKEMIARAIHYNSVRAEHPFVAIDCNALSEHLLESELFGHVKGAFTGAVVNKRGVFEVASQGTLFLDEFGNLSSGTQAKLLRVLQEKEFRAVGSTQVQRTDARIIAATNRDLRTLVAAGSFREDLFYRINVFPLHAPPLRERREDIPALAAHFLKRFADEFDSPARRISETAMTLLIHHDWPGNVRELENVLQRAAILANDEVIRQAHLAELLDADVPPAIDVPRTGEDLKHVKKTLRERSVDEVERQFVLEALRRNDQNVTRSAEDTGMQRANFQALMKKHGIRVRERDADAAPEAES